MRSSTYFCRHISVGFFWVWSNPLKYTRRYSMMLRLRWLRWASARHWIWDRPRSNLVRFSSTPAILALNMQAECVGLCVMDLLQTAQILCIYVLYYMSYYLSSLYRCWFCCMWLQEISITGISITGAPWGILWCNSGPSCNTESSNWCRNVYIHNSSISHLIGLENNKKNICFLETFVVFRLSLQYTCNVIMTK